MANDAIKLIHLKSEIEIPKSEMTSPPHGCCVLFSIAMGLRLCAFGALKKTWNCAIPSLGKEEEGVK